jgi:hypothetical protein
MRGLRFKCLIVAILFALAYTYTRLIKSATRSRLDEVSESSEQKFVQSSLDVALRDEIARDKAYLTNELNTSRLTRASSSYKTVFEDPPRNIKSKADFLIVEYTNVFFQPKFCSHSNEQIFNSELERCKFQNCRYTCDKSEASLRAASALIFHQRDLEHELESVYKSDTGKWLQNTKQFPFRTIHAKVEHNPEWVWVLWNDEATRVNTEFNKLSSFFNWTLSFRTSSEIYKGSYGFFDYRPDEMVTRPEELAKLKAKIYANEFRRRRNGILWFVNNCVKSRLAVALEISRAYPVTIYTSCEIDKSELSGYRNLKLVRDKCEKDSKCERAQFAGYKYYLAFENTNCSDYVTEKIWKALGANMVPIVYQPSRDSYKRLGIPDKAFIHMEDFGLSAEKLADYLTRLDGNFNMYYEFVKWTYVYARVRFRNGHTEPHRMCHMCQMLNEYRPRVVYDWVASFFNHQCVGY